MPEGRGHRRPPRLAASLQVLIAAAACTWALAAAPAASASAPGTNGSIVEMECPAGGCQLTNRDAEGQNPEAVPNFTSANDYSYDADGQVGAISTWDGTNGITIFTAAGDGQPITISGLGEDDGYMNPVLSPDGKWVAFDVGDPESNYVDLYVAPSDGSSAPVELEDGVADDFFPAWTPDSNSVVLFAKDDDGGEDLVAINVATAALTTIGATNTEGIFPYVAPTDVTDWQSGSFHVDDISPDGKHALLQASEFAGSSGQPYRLWEVNLADGALLSNSEYAAGDSIITGAAYAPDGKLLAIHELDETGANPFNGEHLMLHQLHGSGNVSVAINPTATTAYGGDVLWETLGPHDPDITSGPEDPSDLTSASFEFSDVDPGVSFECSLDGAAWAPCDSPAGYAGLADGAHTFEVRSKDADGDYSDVTTWKWTIGSQKPEVVIDSAPSGDNNAPDETISFHGSEDGLSFTCQLDDAAAVPCGSPQQYLGLADGQHTVTIVATDDFGNSSTPAVVSFSVKQAPANVPPPTSGCSSASAVTQASSGNIFLVARGGACLLPSTSGGVAVWSTTGPVTLNGILITPSAGTTITLTRAASTGTVHMSGAFSVTVGSLPAVTIATGASFREDAGLLTVGSALKFARAIGGLDVADTPPLISLTSANGGTAKITLSLTLPPPFGTVPGTKSQVGLAYVITASNNNGVSLLGGNVTVPELYLGAVHLKNLSIAYDGASDTWTGTVGVGLGPGSEGPTAVMSVTLGPSGPTSLVGPLHAASLVVQDIDKPIPDTPIFLQKVGGGVSEDTGTVGGVKQSYLTVSGVVGLSLGPELPYLKKPVVSFEGGLSWSFSDPWVFTATGSATLLTYPLANAKTTITCCSKISVTLQGNVNLSVAGFGLSAGLVQPTFFEGRDQFNLAAQGTINLGGLLSQQAEAVFSNKGFAACATLTGLFGHTAVGWGIDASGHEQVFADTCDLGPYMASPSAAAPTPAGHVRTVRLGATQGPRLLAIHGAGAAPWIALRGPGKITASTGSNGSAVRTAAALVVPDASTHTTYVLLARAPAGLYRISSRNVTVTSVGTAVSLPPPDVHVQVRALRGGRRQLTYSQHTAPGQTLQLLSLGMHGGASQVLLTTTRRHGSVSFTPALGGGARRQILAVVTNRGLPRGRTVVAHFRVADAPPRPVRQLKQSKGRLRWHPSTGARSYLVAFLDGDDRTLKLIRTRHTAVRIPRGAKRVAIVALDRIQRASKPARLRLKIR